MELTIPLCTCDPGWAGGIVDDSDGRLLVFTEYRNAKFAVLRNREIQGGKPYRATSRENAYLVRQRVLMEEPHAPNL